MFKASDYGIPKPPVATTVMIQKQELVSAQFGAPMFREYDHDGLLLDLFGTFDGKEFDVLEVSITGTRFSVLKLVEGCRDEKLKYSLLETMTVWCYSQYAEEQIIADDSSEEDQLQFIQDMKL